MKVYERVIVTNDLDCTSGSDKLAVVHACKSPCHQRALGYSGKLQNTHPNYLVFETDNDLFLNIIDPPVPLFKPPLFSRFLDFSNKHWNNGQELLIHCNQGESRAPSLALLCWRSLKTDQPCSLKIDQGKKAEGRSLGCG